MIVYRIVILISFLDCSLLVWNVTDFCLLILDSTILLSSLIRSSRFLVNFLGFSVLKSMSSANKDGFTSSFSIRMPLAFPCLTAWLGPPAQCWREVVKWTSLPAWSQWESCWPLTMNCGVNCGSLLEMLYRVENIAIWLIECFCHEWRSGLFDCFCCLYWWSCGFLSLIYLVWLVTQIKLHMLNEPYIPGINPTYSPYNPFYVLVDSVCWLWVQA